ncbi:oligopeptide/dipeptide ABC transporter ATP-binding protein, partial [Rhodococcus rhodochrous]
NPPAGCTFHPRCRSCMDVCRSEIPLLRQKEEGHWVSCHLE